MKPLLARFGVDLGYAMKLCFAQSSSDLKDLEWKLRVNYGRLFVCSLMYYPLLIINGLFLYWIIDKIELPLIFNMLFMILVVFYLVFILPILIFRLLVASRSPFYKKDASAAVEAELLKWKDQG